MYAVVASPQSGWGLKIAVRWYNQSRPPLWLRLSLFAAMNVIAALFVLESNLTPVAKFGTYSSALLASILATYFAMLLLWRVIASQVVRAETFGKVVFVRKEIVEPRDSPQGPHDGPERPGMRWQT